MTASPDEPPQLPWRSRAVDAAIGGTTSTSHQQGELVLRHSPTNGCAGFFILWPLLIFGSIVVVEAPQAFKKPAVSSVLAMSVLTAISLSIAGFFLFSFFARDELHVDNRRIRYRRRVLVVTLRRWEAALFDVTDVDVIDTSTPRSRDAAALVITLGDRQRLFGSGAIDEVLAEWAKSLREHIECATGRHLPDSERAGRILADAAERHQRIVREALGSVGLQHESELKGKPELQRKALQHMRESTFADAQARYGPKRSARAAPPPPPPPSKTLGCAAEILYTIFGLGWVGAAVNGTVRVILARRWSLIPLLIGVWGIALTFGLLAWFLMSENLKKLWTAISKLWR